MHALTWLACAAGCLVLWVVQELVGGMIFEGLWLLLKSLASPLLSPFGRGMWRLLVGPHGVAWLRALTLAGLLGLGGGLWLLSAGWMEASLAKLVAGAVAAAVSFAALLWLDSAQARAAVERKCTG
jgi:hypothetical protein